MRCRATAAALASTQSRNPQRASPLEQRLYFPEGLCDDLGWGTLEELGPTSTPIEVLHLVRQDDAGSAAAFGEGHFKGVALL